MVPLSLVRAERSTAFHMMISIQRLIKKTPGGPQDESSNAQVIKNAETD